MFRSWNESGFTLLEVVFTVGVLVIVLLGFFALITQDLQTTELIKEREAAAKEAQSQMEHLQGLSQAEIASLIPATAPFITELPASSEMVGILAPDPPNPVVIYWMDEAEAAAAFGVDSLDLDGNGSTTDVPTSAFRMFPVRVTVYWRSNYGLPGLTTTDLDCSTDPGYPVLFVRVIGMIMPGM